MDISSVKFDQNGLVAAVVQDVNSHRVLTVAYMNEESLKLSIKEGRTVFYSRSRQCLWRKGETSGNVQKIISITADCDGDALVILVEKEGPACHLGTESCFQNLLYGKQESEKFSNNALFELLKERNIKRPQGSYTTYLFEKGREKILKKVGEEATEVVIAGTKNDKQEMIYELADLYYHALVLMADADISLQEVGEELHSRHIIDHKIKQENR